MELAPRQRLLTVLRHEVADRLPWAPKFATWIDVHRRRNELPPLLYGCEHWHDAARALGVDIFDKCGPVVRASTPSVQVIETKGGEYSSPAAGGVDDAVRESLKVPARVWRAVFAARWNLEGDFADELGAIRAPTLVVWGDHDARYPRADQDRLVALSRPPESQ